MPDCISTQNRGAGLIASQWLDRILMPLHMASDESWISTASVAGLSALFVLGLSRVGRTLVGLAITLSSRPHRRSRSRNRELSSPLPDMTRQAPMETGLQVNSLAFLVLPAREGTWHKLQT